MSCNCIRNFIRNVLPKPCDECLRFTDITVMSIDAVEAGSTIDVDLVELTSAPTNCGEIVYSVYSFDAEGIANAVIVDNEYITITGVASGAESGKLYTVIVSAECTDSNYKDYARISTEVK